MSRASKKNSRDFFVVGRITSCHTFPFLFDQVWCWWLQHASGYLYGSIPLPDLPLLHRSIPAIERCFSKAMVPGCSSRFMSADLDTFIFNWIAVIVNSYIEKLWTGLHWKKMNWIYRYMSAFIVNSFIFFFNELGMIPPHGKSPWRGRYDEPIGDPLKSPSSQKHEQSCEWWRNPAVARWFSHIPIPILSMNLPCFILFKSLPIAIPLLSHGNPIVIHNLKLVDGSSTLLSIHSM